MLHEPAEYNAVTNFVEAVHGELAHHNRAEMTEALKPSITLVSLQCVLEVVLSLMVA